METIATKKNNVFFFEDYSVSNLNENKVGRKGLSLFRLKDMDVPVPEFFVISKNVFTDFCFKNLDLNLKELLEKGRNPEPDEIASIFDKSDFDPDVEEDLLSAYTRLSGFTDSWVSVRSSVVFPEDPEVSFSGIFATELNVRKFEELKSSVKRIYASVFNDDVVAYASKMGIDIADIRMCVVVQKMVQAEVSGVSFTIDPITQDISKLSIEAVYGLGDVIALGEITPDSYLLNKKDLSIVEKHIAPQEWMKVRSVNVGNRRRNSTEKIKISSSWSHRQKLSDKDMEEIAKISLIVENKSRQSQNIEWVMSGGRVAVLQSKSLYEPILKERISASDGDISRNTLREFVEAFVEKYKGAQHITNQAVEEAKKIVQRNKSEIGNKLDLLINAARMKKDTPDENTWSKSNISISGIGASFGTVVGKVSILDNPTSKQYTRKDILYIKKFSSEMESSILSCGGVIMDTGGLTSDTAIMCREFNIPAVLGVLKASEVLKEGDWVRLDGNSGSIYKVEEPSEEKPIDNQPQHPVVEAYADGVDLLNKVEEIKKEELKPEDEVISLQIPRDNTLPPSATKVFSMSDLKPSEMIDYVGNSNGIVEIDLDRIMIEDGRHIMAYVEDKTFVDYSRKISEKILEYANLAQGDLVVISIGSATVGEFRDLKKGKTFEDPSLSDESYGAAHYVNNSEMLNRVIKIIKRIRNVYKKRNVSIALHSPMNSDFVKEFKKQLSAEKLRRTSTFGIYAILDNPSEIIMADEILSTKIDGLILNMPRIARLMQGIKLDAKNAKYDLGRNSVFKVVDNVLDSVKRSGSKTIVIVENSKPLLRYCVNAGVYGISVSTQDIAEARKVVAEEESKLILGR